MKAHERKASAHVIEFADGRCLVDKMVSILKAEDDKGLIALVSTDSVDSDGDIIHQGTNENGKGWDLERFNKHPVMLWSHDIRIPSLGTGHAWVGESEMGKGLHFRPVFDSGDEFARQIQGKIERGVISETSVGFGSDNYDRRKAEGDEWPGFDFWDSYLVEISWVNRGANPDVDSMMKTYLKNHPSMIKEIKTFEDPVLDQMKVEFVDRLTEIETRLRSIEDGIIQGATEDVSEVVDDCLKAFGQIFK